MNRAARRLCPLEAEAARAHGTRAGHGRSTTHIALRAPLPPARVDAAVESWRRRVPRLSLRIAAEDGGLRFVPAPQPPRVRHGPPGADADPDGVLRAELNTPLPPDGPLWRLRTVADPGACLTHLYLTRHPALCDDFSARRLVRSLLDELLPGAEEPTPCPGTEHPPPDTGTLTYRPPPAPGPGRSADDGPVPGPSSGRGDWAERGTGVLPLRLSADESRRLRRWCAREGITATEFFAAVLARSAARTAGRADVELGTTVSLRRRWAESPLVQETGRFCREVPTRLYPSGGSTADDARAYARALRAADAAWRPGARGQARLRRDTEESAGRGPSGGPCVTAAGAVDTVLGPHAPRVTGFRTAVARPDATGAGTLHLLSLRGAFDAVLTFGTPGGSGPAEATAEALRAEVASATAGS